MVLQNGEAAGADGEEVEPEFFFVLGLVRWREEKKVSGFEGEESCNEKYTAKAGKGGGKTSYHCMTTRLTKYTELEVLRISKYRSSLIPAGGTPNPNQRVEKGIPRRCACQ